MLAVVEAEAKQALLELVVLAAEQMEEHHLLVVVMLLLIQAEVAAGEATLALVAQAVQA